MSDSLPAKVGKYEVSALLGEGGFGRVYQAFDPTVGRPVAIKVLTLAGSSEMLARFRNEAMAAGNLHHSNIVTIYEFGLHEGAPYIAMEYLEGYDLQQVLSSGTELTLLEKIRIMAQVGEGLRCAHDNGVVHRDVKPANIRVMPNGVVKILDFGIARLTGEDATRLTGKGEIIGTVRYMAPEQFDETDVDSLCDIFAFGVIFYELLTGSHPFQAPDVRSFIYKLSQSDPIPLGEVRADLPLALQQVVMRLLEKDRDLRYQRLQEVLIDLRPVQVDLQKERAGELLLKTRQLFDAGQIAQANVCIGEAIDLDSSDPQVRELRERIQQLAHRQTLRPKIDALLKSAERDLAGRRFSEAIEALETAARLDPTHSEAGERLKQARHQWEAARQAARLLADADREFSRQNLTLAERLAAQALELDPTNPKAAELAEAVRSDLERREEERRLRATLEEARRFAALEDFESAIACLEGLTGIRDPAGEVPALLARVGEQKQEFDRQEHLRTAKQEVRSLLKESRFADALPRLEALCGEFAEDSYLATLLSDTRQQVRMLQRAEDVRKAGEEAAEFREAGRFAEAEERIRRLSAAYPKDSEIQFMAQEAARYREDHERRQRVAEIIRTAAQLSGEGRFDEARQILDAGLRDIIEDASLLDALEKLQSDWSSHRRTARVRQLVASGRARMAEGNYNSAIGLLKQALAEDSQNEEIQGLLEEARRLLDQQRVTRAVDQVCAQARDLANAHDFQTARALLERSRKAYPDDQRLLALAEVIARQEHEWDRELRLREAIQSSSQLIREKQYSEASQSIGQQLETWPGEPGLLRLLDQCNAEWEAAKRSHALALALSEMRTALAENRVDEAASMVERYAGEFGSAPEFVAVRSQAEEAVRRAERARQIEETLQHIRNLEDQRNWEAALKVCQVANIQYPDAPALAECFARIQQQLTRDRREADVSKFARLARQAIAVKDWETATQKLDELHRRFPDEATLSNLRDDLQSERRRDETDRTFAEVEKTVAGRDWALAEKLLETAEALAPNAPQIATSRASIERGKLRDRALQDARSALSEGRFEDASRLLNPLVSGGADAEVSALMLEVHSQRTAVEAEESIRQGRTRAEALSQDRQFDAAVRLLQDVIQRHGTRAELQREMEQYAEAAERQRLDEVRRAAHAAEQRRAELAGLTKRLAELVGHHGDRGVPGKSWRAVRRGRRGQLSAGELDAADRFLAEALLRFPDDSGLLEWKNRLAARRAAAQQGAEGDFSTVRTLLVVGIALAVLLVAGNWIRVLVFLSNAPSPLALTDAVLADGRVGELYGAVVTASGGVAPYRWSISTGQLPPGLRLDSSAGKIDGTPSSEGEFAFRLRLTDGGSGNVDRAFRMSVRAATARAKPPETAEPRKAAVLTLVPATPPDGRVGVPYAFVLTASGGSPPYRWSIARRSLPAGLRLNPTRGSIDGTPSRDGLFDFSVRLTDSAQGVTEQALRLTILPEARQTTPAPGPAAPGPTSQPPAPAAPRCPPAKPTFTIDTYPYDLSGSIEWRGQPSPDRAIVIVGRSATEGSTTAASLKFYGAPVKVTIPPEQGKILEPPSRGNGWLCIAFQPAANSVKIDWKVDWQLDQR